MKPTRNGVEGDADQHFSTGHGLDKPQFLVEHEKPSTRAPEHVRERGDPPASRSRGARPR